MWVPPTLNNSQQLPQTPLLAMKHERAVLCLQLQIPHTSKTLLWGAAAASPSLTQSQPDTVSIGQWTELKTQTIIKQTDPALPRISTDKQHGVHAAALAPEVLLFAKQEGRREGEGRLHLTTSINSPTRLEYQMLQTGLPGDR